MGIGNIVQHWRREVKEGCVLMENYSNEELLNIGIELFEKTEYVEAIEAFATILGREKNDLAHQYIARCFYRLEKYEAAYRHFEILATHAEGKMKDYGASMMATIEEMRGNIGKAIKILRSLPNNPTNTVNLAIMYWKEYKIKKGEHSIREAMKLLDNITSANIPDIFVQRINHLKALFNQAQKEYKLAEKYYLNALLLSETNPMDRGSILNDYSSLLIECQRYSEAKEKLLMAQDIVKGKNELEEALNNKWLGILAIRQGQYHQAKILLDKAIKVIKDRALLVEVAGITFLLSELTTKEDDNFYKAADYYADGVALEKLLKEVKERDEKIINLYFDNFYVRSNNNNSGIG